MNYQNKLSEFIYKITIMLFFRVETQYLYTVYKILYLEN